MKLHVAILLACTGLAACGGGGGGGGGGSSPAPVASTPAPAAQTNTTVNNPTVSQTFPSLGVTANSTVSPGTVSNSLVGAGLDGVSVAYNAANQSYTISSGTGSATFAPGDRDAALSSALLTTYSRKSGSTTDNLLLGNAGAAGFSYVNMGAWLRTVESTGSATLNSNYFAYGVPTAASDLPRTGSATYTTDATASWSTGSDLRTLSGVGSLTANFGAGTVQTSLSMSGASAVTGAVVSLNGLSGTASINSANATFSGGMAGAGYSGALAGRFYGPAAAEVGATFSLSSGGNVVAGAFIGKK